MKVTVLNIKEDLGYVNKGDKINFKLNKLSGISEAYIEAYIGASKIGIISISPNNLAPGCKLATDVVNSNPNSEEFEGVVIGYYRLPNGINGLVVELGSNSLNNNNNKVDKIYELKVQGSLTKYPNKSKVLSAFDEGAKVFVELKICEDNKIVVYYKDILAGVVEEKDFTNKSTTKEIEELKELINIFNDKNKIVEGKVVFKNPRSYDIRVAISNEVFEEVKTSMTLSKNNDIKAELVSKGFDETELKKIEEYLYSNGLDIEDIQDVFKTYKVYPKEIQFRVPKNPKLFNDNFDGIKKSVLALNNQCHILCTGEKGTGKNTLIETIAWVYQRPLYSLAINRETDKIDIIGSKSIDTEVQDGQAVNKITFSPEVLLEAMENGGIFNVDEINFADPAITGLFHSILDDRRELEVPGYKKVVADDNFAIMATMNNNYQGTVELNEALNDRFVPLLFPMNDSIFTILETSCPNATKKEITVADSIYKKMVSMVRDRDDSIDMNCVTIRGFIQALKLKKLGLKTAIEMCVADKIQDEEYRINVKNIINALI